MGAPDEQHVETLDQIASQVDTNAHHPKGWMNWRVLMNVVIIGLALGLYGYDNSFVSPLLSLPLFIQRYQGNASSTFTADNLDLLVSIPLIGAAFGGFLSIPLQNRVGRKWSFITAYALCSTPGSFLQLFAPNIAAMICGRFWNYVGISILTTVCPLYLADMVPVHVRGRTVGMAFGGSAAVSVIATVVVWATEKYDDSRQYKIPLGVQAGFAGFLGILTLFCTESPTWYVLHDRVDDARRALMEIRRSNPEVVEAELSLTLLAIKEDRERRQNAHFWDILNKRNIKRTLTAGALISVSQVGGQILVLQYATVVLVQSHVANPFKITMIITTLQFAGVAIGPTLVDKVGRRPVAMIGFIILFILDLAIAGVTCTGLTTNSSRLGLAALFVIFGFFNSMSFQSLNLLMPAELPTPRLREATSAWTLFWSYVTATVTTFAVPQLTETANLGAKTDFIFAGCMAIVIVGTYFYLPETMGRTLAEIDEMYDIGLPMRKWRGYKCVGTSQRAAVDYIVRKERMAEAE